MHIRYKDTIRKLLRISNGRKLIFYGFDALTKYVYQDLRELGEDVAYFVSEELAGMDYQNKEIRSKFDLLYEDKTEIFIVGFVISGHREIYGFLTELGFELEKDFWLVGLGGYSSQFDAVDSLLGYNRYCGKLLGFEVYGEIAENSYQILVLGGSTVDSTVGAVPKCWAYLLYEKLVASYGNIVVINGGMGGYATWQELYKLIRDGLNLNPQMVVTFDGFNDVSNWVGDDEYPHLLKYQKKVYDHIEQRGDFAPDTLDLRNAKKIVHGMRKRNGQDAEQWFHNIRKIHAICMEFGIEYVSFLQPLIKVGKPIIEEEHWKLLEDAGKVLAGLQKSLDHMQKFYMDVKQLINGKEYIYDLTSIFDGKEDTYYDICHSTQYGHEIIAESVFGIIHKKLCGG